MWKIRLTKHSLSRSGWSDNSGMNFAHIINFKPFGQIDQWIFRQVDYKRLRHSLKPEVKPGKIGSNLGRTSQTKIKPDQTKSTVQVNRSEKLPIKQSIKMKILHHTGPKNFVSLPTAPVWCKLTPGWNKSNTSFCSA